MVKVEVLWYLQMRSVSVHCHSDKGGEMVGAKFVEVEID